MNLLNRWHVAINQYAQDKLKLGEFPSWLYRAKDAANEVPRLAMLFNQERNGNLAKVHHQCSHDANGTPVEDNHLTCALGVKCRQCPFLLALDKTEATPEQIDQIKAWTCVTHILTKLGENDNFDVSEGFIQTVDDQMYWQNIYASMSDMSSDDDEEFEAYRPPYSEDEN